MKQLTDVIDDVVTLMSSRKLKLNGIKTGFLVVFSPQQLLKKYGRPDNIVVDGAVIRPVRSAHNIGSHFDIHLSMVSRVSTICRKYNFHFRRTAPIRAYILKAVFLRPVIVLVVSSLDYCKGPLTGFPGYQTTKALAGSSPPNGASRDMH